MGVLLLGCINTHSQSINDLDNKNGFKIFHLGEPIASIPDLETEKTLLTPAYKYHGDCCPTFLGMKIHDIFLQPDKNRNISSITFFVDGFKDLHQLDDVLQRVISSFGIYTYHSPLNMSLDESYQWCGKKVVLDMDFKFDKDSKKWLVSFDLWSFKSRSNTDF